MLSVGNRFPADQDSPGKVDRVVVVVVACVRNFLDMFRSVAWADRPGSFDS